MQDERFELIQALYPGMKLITFCTDLHHLAQVQALTIHPNSQYSVFIHNRQYYLMETTSYTQKIGDLFPDFTKPKRLKSFYVQDLEGLRVKDPLTLSKNEIGGHRVIPVLSDESLDRTSNLTMIHPHAPGCCPKDNRSMVQ